VAVMSNFDVIDRRPSSSGSRLPGFETRSTYDTTGHAAPNGISIAIDSVHAWRLPMVHSSR